MQDLWQEIPPGLPKETCGLPTFRKKYSIAHSVLDLRGTHAASGLEGPQLRGPLDPLGEGQEKAAGELHDVRQDPAPQINALPSELASHRNSPN